MGCAVVHIPGAGGMSPVLALTLNIKDARIISNATLLVPQRTFL